MRPQKQAILVVPTISMAIMLWGGAYFVLVSRTPAMAASTISGPMPVPPCYQCGGAFAETVFFPLHWVDRQLRPHYWSIDIESDLVIEEPPGGQVTSATNTGQPQNPTSSDHIR